MLIPALDLLAGQVVRLYQGDFAQKTVFADDPLPLAQNYQEDGAQLLHLVDLDGVKDPNQRQLPLLNRLAKELSLPLQVGGGIRRTEDIAVLREQGVQRVVVGSAAIRDPQLASEWLQEFGAEHIVLALDLRVETGGRRTLFTHGWQKGSSFSLEDFWSSLSTLPQHVLCTDISKDGTLKGPNVALYADLVREYPQINWQASGGVAQLSDLSELASAGVQGVILGKALLTKQFTLQEAQQCWSKAAP